MIYTICKKCFAVGFLALCMFAVFGKTECKAIFGNDEAEMVKWNTEKTYKVKADKATYNAVLSMDKSEAWIYRVDTTEKTTELIFPNKIKDVPVTKVGYDYSIFKDKYNITSDDLDYNFENIFGVFMEGYHDIYGYTDRIKNITNIELPSELNWIVPGAFSGLRKIKEVVIPDGVTKIPYEAFADCSQLESIQLPASLSKENLSNVRFAFPKCPKLKNITISEDSPYCSIKNNCLLSKNGKKLFFAISCDKALKIPSRVRTIKCGALAFCTSETIYIGKKVSNLETGALSNDYIKSIIISKDNKHYKSYKNYVLNKKDKSIAVYILTGEDTFRIPKNVKLLTANYSKCGENAYKKVIISKHLKKVSGHWGNAFDGITRVYFESKVPPTQIMENITKHNKILPWEYDVYVPKNSRKVYVKWYKEIEDSSIAKRELNTY